MNYPLGTKSDPSAPFNQPEPDRCPECGAALFEEADDYNKEVDYECSECDYKETICY